ncbi:MAG TPA: hypothetical protein VEJ47_17760 [Candidatus Eremiobacteraceae bacterium]|nr:hypothetical protein [Candidatus Eremiobacteraceae bacterium]
MRYLKYAALLGALIFTVAAGSTRAQVAVGVRVGPVGVAVGAPPICPYGYYGYYPYACAPYGYYGPSWFANGVFIGAGPWYHGYWGRGFYGHPGWHNPYRPYYRPGYAYHPPVHGFVSGGYHGGFHGGAVRGR